MRNNLDHLFKKALHDRNCEPPSYIWDNIEHRLNKRRRMVGAWWLRGVAAAALVAALAAIWLIQKPNPNTLLTDVTEQAIFSFPQDTSTLKIEIAQAELETQANIPGKKTKTFYKEQVINKEVAPIPVNVIRADIPVAIPTTSPVIKLTTKHLRKDYIALTSKEALQNNLEYQMLLKETPQKEKSEKERIRVALSGHFIPAYSSGVYSSSAKSPKGNSYSDSQMEGLMNNGGGLKIAIAKGHRFSIQTGIFYSRMGQKSTEIANSVSMAAFATNSEPRYSTPLGNVKSRTKAVAFRSPEAFVLNSVGNVDETLEQIFGTLEIPLQIRYKLNENKFSFSVVVGFSSNFIVNNKVYLKSGNDKELLGSTEGIRNFNMSTDWGLGVEYPVTRNIKVMMEPGFKYYLQSLSQNRDINFKPYMLTFSTGIGIEF